jgi:uncharacterized protein (TIGR03084 family)
MADLTADAAEFDALVAEQPAASWATPTPAPGWTVAHQVGHLSFIFRIAGLAASDPDRFTAVTSSAGGNFNAAVNGVLAEYVPLPPDRLLARWRAERDAGIAALSAVPGDRLVPWLVNPLPPAVLAAAGMMELFGHGQDIADALGIRREFTDRLYRVVEFVVRVRDFGYQARGLNSPTEPFRFEVTAPSGAAWLFGPPDAKQRVSGPAVDLCLLATRRRHRADLAVTAVGDEADRWLDIAQAYRGPAGAGRKPGQFAVAR